MLEGNYTSKGKQMQLYSSSSVCFQEQETVDSLFI